MNQPSCLPSFEQHLSDSVALFSLAVKKKIPLWCLANICSQFSFSFISNEHESFQGLHPLFYTWFSFNLSQLDQIFRQHFKAPLQLPSAPFPKIFFNTGRSPPCIFLINASPHVCPNNQLKALSDSGVQRLLSACRLCAQPCFHFKIHKITPLLCSMGECLIIALQK